MWQDVWNKERKSFGIGMKGKTLYEKFEEAHDKLINKKIVDFPVFMMEDLGKLVDSAVLWFSKYEPTRQLLQGGKYLHTKCPSYIYLLWRSINCLPNNPIPLLCVHSALK